MSKKLNLEACTEIMGRLRVSGSLSRWSSWNPVIGDQEKRPKSQSCWGDGTDKQDHPGEPCCASLPYYLNNRWGEIQKDEMYLLYPFNGGHNDTLSTFIVKKTLKNFTATKDSLEFIELIMRPESPWAALHPFMVMKDPEYINDYGFIFENLKDVNCTLLYNFLMGIRHSHEFPSKWGQTRFLIDKGVPWRMALLAGASADSIIEKEKVTVFGGYGHMFIDGDIFTRVTRFSESLFKLDPKATMANQKGSFSYPPTNSMFIETDGAPVKPRTEFEGWRDLIGYLDAIVKKQLPGLKARK